MPRVLPPPPERFDPVTARWVTPGGPLHDPQRDSLDPDHGEPVSLVAPIPRELAEAEGLRSDRGSDASPAARLRWVVLAVLALGIAAMLVGGFLIV